MGAIPTSCPASRTSSATARRGRAFEAAWGCQIVPRYGWNLTQMFEGMKRGELRSLYVIGENPQSEADIKHTRELLGRPRLPRGAGHPAHQDGRDGRRRAALERLLVRG